MSRPLTQPTPSGSSSSVESTIEPVASSWYTLLLDEFEKYLHSLLFSSFSITAYKKDCLDFCNYLDQNSILLEQVGIKVFNNYSQYLLEIKQDRPTSIRRKLLAIRKFFSFLESSKKTSSTFWEEIILPKRNDNLPVDLKTDKISSLLSTLYKSSHSLRQTRDVAVFLLLALEGLKSSEIVSLRWSDFISSLPDTSGSSSTSSTSNQNIQKDPSSSNESYLKVSGARQRMIELKPQVSSMILAYRSNLYSVLNETLPSNMFVCFKSRTLNAFTSLSTDGIKFIIRQISDQFNVQLNAELLRHYSIDYMLSLGLNQQDIMMHLGVKRAGSICKHARLLKNNTSAINLDI